MDNDRDDSVKWHAKLGHIDQDRMIILVREGLLGPLAKINLPTYEHCLPRKIIQKSFSKATWIEYPLQLIHSNICSPMNVRIRHDSSYFFIFMDDHTYFCYAI